METKQELLSRLRQKRADLGEHSRLEASALICQKIAHLCTSRRWTRIGLFWPHGPEPDLRPLVQSHGNWTFYFPKVTSSSPPRLAWGPEPLEQGYLGLMEPSFAQQFLPPVQLLLVPGLAFDDLGFRLGYGGGYFDALLERLPEEVITLGVSFQALRVPNLPVEPHDLPVDGVVTEQALEWFIHPEVDESSFSR